MLNMITLTFTVYIPELDNHKNIIEKYYKQMFFVKHNDWIQEDERRLICLEGSEYLSINNCIEFICLSNKFEKESYYKLSDILISSIKKDLKILKPHDFTLQSNLVWPLHKF